MESNTATVARTLPRKIKIISAVSTSPMSAFVAQILESPS